MKFVAAFMLGMVGSAVFAAGPPLTEFCQPFTAGKTELVWNATNRTPQRVRFFKVLPTRFTAETVSNALDLAQLTPANRLLPRQGGILGGKDVLAFENRDKTRHLDIVPSQGTIAINRKDVIALPREPVVNVPSTNDVIRLLFNLLPKLGIRQSEVVTNEQGQPVPYTFFEQKDIHKDKASGKIITNVVSRAVSLSRQIDGIPVWGTAGAFAQFGNEAKIADLNVTWRAIESDGECPVPSPAEFMALLKSTGSLIRREQAEERYGKVSVKNVRLYYWESDASQSQSHIYPFAVLDADTDVQGENARIQLFIPLNYH